MNYHMAIDMWSLGCILAELYTGFPIFPGENEQEQLSCIMEVLGIPDKEFVNRSSRKKLFFGTVLFVYHDENSTQSLFRYEWGPSNCHKFKRSEAEARDQIIGASSPLQ